VDEEYSGKGLAKLKFRLSLAI